MRTTIDTQAPAVQFQDDFSPAAGGLFHLAQSLWEAPQTEARLQLQRQAIQNQGLWRQMAVGERQRHDEATETNTANRNDNDAVYDANRLLEDSKSGKNTGDEGTLPTASLMNYLAYDQTPVPIKGADGTPMLDTDGKPVLRYMKSRRPDAEARMRAAGIDPVTGRYAHKGPAAPAPAGTTAAPQGAPTASPAAPQAPAGSPSAGPSGALPPQGAQQAPGGTDGAPAPDGSPDQGNGVQSLWQGLQSLFQPLGNAFGVNEQPAPPMASSTNSGYTPLFPGASPQFQYHATPGAAERSITPPDIDPTPYQHRDPRLPTYPAGTTQSQQLDAATSPNVVALNMNNYRFNKSIPGTDHVDATADQNPDMMRLRQAMSFVPPAKQGVIFQKRVAPLLNPDGSLRDPVGAQALTADLLHAAAVHGTRPVNQDSAQSLLDNGSAQPAAPAPSAPMGPPAPAAPAQPQGPVPAPAAPASSPLSIPGGGLFSTIGM